VQIASLRCRPLVSNMLVLNRRAGPGSDDQV
jgi:hypothetical protein